jgi:hypothetical protein
VAAILYSGSIKALYLEISTIHALPLPRKPVTGIPTLRSRFDPTPINMGHVVDNMTLGQTSI